MTIRATNAMIAMMMPAMTATSPPSTLTIPPISGIIRLPISNGSAISPTMIRSSPFGRAR